MNRKIIDIINNYAWYNIVNIGEGDHEESLQYGVDDGRITYVEPDINSIIETIVPENQGTPIDPEEDPEIEKDESMDLDDISPRHEGIQGEEGNSKNVVTIKAQTIENDTEEQAVGVIDDITET